MRNPGLSSASLKQQPLGAASALRAADRRLTSSVAARARAGKRTGHGSPQRPSDVGDWTPAIDHLPPGSVDHIGVGALHCMLMNAKLFRPVDRSDLGAELHAC
jgi:hypothetical protein